MTHSTRRHCFSEDNQQLFKEKAVAGADLFHLPLPVISLCNKTKAWEMCLESGLVPLLSSA